MMSFTRYRNYSCSEPHFWWCSVVLGVQYAGRLGVSVGACLSSMFGGAPVFCTLVFAVVARMEVPSTPHPRSRGTEVSVSFRFWLNGSACWTIRRFGGGVAFYMSRVVYRSVVANGFWQPSPGCLFGWPMIPIQWTMLKDVYDVMCRCVLIYFFGCLVTPCFELQSISSVAFLSPHTISIACF